MHVVDLLFTCFTRLAISPVAGLVVALPNGQATANSMNGTRISSTGCSPVPVPDSPPFARQDSVRDCEGVPTIGENEVVVMMKSYHAAYNRYPRVSKMEAATHMSHDMAKYTYKMMHRNCPIAFPPPDWTNPARCNLVAVIKSGQTRSFIKCPKLLDYWNTVMSAFRRAGREPVIFAVFDEHSTSPKRAGVPQVAHKDEQQAIGEVLRRLVRDHRVAYLSGQGSMEAHRAKVVDPRIKAILTPWNRSETAMFNGGAQAGYMKWIVGLDLMLKYERENPQICFSHVLHTRPDYVWTSWMNPSVLKDGLTHLHDAAFIVNDAAAIMPREAAGAYFSTFAMNRALHGGKSKWAALLRGLVHTAGAGGLLPPAASLAYHGILFAGEGLDFPTGSLKYPGFVQTDQLGFFVREDNQNGPCVENQHFSTVFGLPQCAKSFHNDLLEFAPSPWAGV